MSGSDEARALRVMVEALRAEPTPELPWDAIEQKLLARIEAEAETATNGAAELESRTQTTTHGRDHARTEPGGGASVTRAIVGLADARSALPGARGPSAVRRTRSGGAAGWIGFAAAAAALMLGIQVGARGSVTSAPHARGAAASPVDVASLPLGRGRGSNSPSSTRDATALHAGDVVATGEQPVTFALEGTVRWTLAPSSRLVVRAVPRPGGVGHVVALEHGAISAEVVPRDAAEGLVEAFAVEVRGTRVAVHGTAFSVVREAERLLVDVEHGAVAVGPVGHVGITTGRLLIGPSRAAFSLDGGRTARLLSRGEPLLALGSGTRSDAAAELPALVAAAEPDGARAANDDDAAPRATIATPAAAAPVAPAAGSAVDATASGASPTPAAAPAAEPVTPTLTEAGIRAGLERCFAQTYTDSSPSVRLQITTTLRLSLRDDGSVQKASFNPPLKPAFQTCAGGLIGGHFAEGGREIAIPMSFGSR